MITARIRRMTGGNIFSLFTLAGGGVPHLRSRERGYPIPGPGRGGVPNPRSRWGGSPSQVQVGGYPEYPPTWDGVPPQTWDGVPPQIWGGVPPDLGLGTPPTWDQVPPLDLGPGTPPRGPGTQRVLATQPAVCLLRSRRRTFLLQLFFGFLISIPIFTKRKNCNRPCNHNRNSSTYRSCK